MSVMNDTVQRVLLDHADSEALVGPDGRWTYEHLRQNVNRTSNALATLGLKLGDRLAIFMRNSNAWIATEMGSYAIGVGVIPANQRFNAEELLWILDNSMANAIVFSPSELTTVEDLHRSRPELMYLCLANSDESIPSWATDLRTAVSAADDRRPAIEVPDETLCRIMYTSATTGLPKGVVIDHDHWQINKLHLLVNVFTNVDSDDTYLAATPLTHMAGGWTWTTFLRGGKTVILEKWDVTTFAEICAKENVTLLMMAPTIFVGLLRHLDGHPEDLDVIKGVNFKKIMYGASPMPEAVSNRIEELFGEIMSQCYGFTENIGCGTGMTVTGLPPEWHSRKRLTCGRPVLNTWVRVVDDDGNEVPVGSPGEVVTKPWRPCGIWNNQAATDELLRGGWIHSGDIGVFDEDGFLTLVDRKNNMIVSGGLNVYPAEIENALYSFPGIVECAVVGAPHDYWVETPVAYYVTSEGANVNGEDVRLFLRERLSHYKVPTEYYEIAELPKSSYGKILKRELKGRDGVSANVGMA